MMFAASRNLQSLSSCSKKMLCHFLSSLKVQSRSRSFRMAPSWAFPGVLLPTLHSPSRVVHSVNLNVPAEHVCHDHETHALRLLWVGDPVQAEELGQDGVLMVTHVFVVLGQDAPQWPHPLFLAAAQVPSSWEYKIHCRTFP